MRRPASRHGIISTILEALFMRESINGDFAHGDDKDGYIVGDTPPIGMKVEVIGYLGKSRHVIPFLCCWTEDGWVLAGSRHKLAFEVASWRPVGV